MAGYVEDTSSFPTVSVPNGSYGAEVRPMGPLQDMEAIDTIAGSVHTRDASPASFTGGMGGRGMGGMAEPDAPDYTPVP